MTTVVPTVLATTPEEYAAMTERARSLSQRVHVDICDGRFADSSTLGLAQIQVPPDTVLDLHLMLEDPVSQLETALSLHPNLIIFHAESSGDLLECIKHTRQLGVRAGVALLPQTTVEQACPLINAADHALIFTGTLGHNNGVFQTDQLPKSLEIRGIKPDIEISVDGGVTDHNAALIILQGVDILYVGGFVQESEDPQAAYDSVMRQAGAKSF
jgi:ribulose-phosphate 3-epimerase